jgi:hypothetical protein
MVENSPLDATDYLGLARLRVTLIPALYHKIDPKTKKPVPVPDASEEIRAGLVGDHGGVDLRHATGCHYLAR